MTILLKKLQCNGSMDGNSFCSADYSIGFQQLDGFTFIELQKILQWKLQSIHSEIILTLLLLSLVVFKKINFLEIIGMFLGILALVILLRYGNNI